MSSSSVGLHHLHLLCINISVCVFSSQVVSCCLQCLDQHINKVFDDRINCLHRQEPALDNISDRNWMVRQ